MGKLFVSVLIIYTVVVFIPMQTNELLKLMRLKSFFARYIYKPNPEIPHIVITGQVLVKALKTFCTELFNQDHAQSQERHAVTIQPCDPNNELELFLRDPNYEFSLNYLNGNPFKSNDLARAVTEKAKACIIMTNIKAHDPYGTDHKSILTGLAIKKYVQEMTNRKVNMRLCTQLIKSESKHHYRASTMNSKRHGASLDQIIVIEEMKMNLIAKSCFCPGLITLCSNLIATSTDFNEDSEERWLSEYIEGMNHEIYRVKLSEKMERKYFRDVARIVYKKTMAIVFAIDLKNANGKRVIRLNPNDFLINNIEENDIHVYVICPDKLSADSIKTLEMTREERTRYLILHEMKLKEDKQALEEEGDPQQ